jgi:hypothetical protein
MMMTLIRIVTSIWTATFRTLGLMQRRQRRQRIFGASSTSNLCFVAVNTNLFADNIVSGFPFFPRLHRFLSSCTNTNPPVVVTGVGPQGRAAVHYQAPARIVPPPGDDVIDPALRDLNGPNMITFPSTDSETNSTPTLSPLFPHSTLHPVDKENTSPIVTVKKSKAPMISVSQLVENAKATIKKIPAKRTFEEMLCDLQR